MEVELHSQHPSDQALNSAIVAFQQLLLENMSRSKLP